MNYYLGIDVGGTKTECLIANDEGTVIGFGRGGSGSHEYHGIEHAAQEVRRALQAALADAQIDLADVSYVGLGVAGADQPDDFPMLEEAVYTPLLGETPRVLVNDSFAALRAAGRDSSGLVIACGTGVICAGISPTGDRARAGGWMPEYGDKCTGETLGLEGLNAVWRAREGIVPQTLLTPLYMERAGYDDVDQFFYDVYNKRFNPSRLQPMAQLVFQAGAQGDPVACEILEEGGRYLGMLINAVARKLAMAGESFTVYTAGSVFSEGAPVLSSAMQTQVFTESPNAAFEKPQWQPVVGALLLGIDANAAASNNLYDALCDSLLQSEDKYQKSFKMR